MAGTLTPAVSQRKLIRNAVVALLRDSTRAGPRVYGNRVEPWEHALDGGELPSIGVYTLSETAELSLEAPREYKRTLRVGVDCLLDQQDAKVGDDELDDFTHEVETILLCSEDTSGTVARSVMEEVSIAETDQGERLVLVARLVFAYVYYTRVDELDPSAAMLEKLHVDWRFGFEGFAVDHSAVDDPLRAEQDGPRAEDDIQIP